jgi:putative RNA 2'-phosphotransferase
MIRRLADPPEALPRYAIAMEQHLIKYSKLLSLVLRHNPARLGLTLDPQGWVEVSTLLQAAKQHGIALNAQLLQRIVAENDKQRFAFSADRTLIRASQGHSVAIDLALAPQTPPDLLYHGTASRFLDSIRQNGLEKRSRQHVHLSINEETARRVGARHGKPVILQVAASQMVHAGMHFYCSANGVWLTDHVPVAFLVFPP